MSRKNGESGFVTVELAVGTVAMAILVALAIWGGGVAYTWMQCNEIAVEVAKQAARQDDEAVAAIRSKLTAGTKLEVVNRDSMVTVTITKNTQSWGGLIPSVSVQGVAHAQIAG